MTVTEAEVAVVGTEIDAGKVPTSSLLLVRSTRAALPNGFPLSVTVTLTALPPDVDAGETARALTAIGLTVNLVVFETPSSDAVSVATTTEVGRPETMFTFADVAPTGTTTLLAIGASLALLESDTVVPPVGALAFKVIVATAVLPATTAVGLTVIDEIAAGNTVTVAVFSVESTDEEIVTLLDAVTATEVAANVADVLPLATVTVAGTFSAEELLDDSDTTCPLDGAAALSFTVPVTELPPVRLVAENVNDDTPAAITRGGATTRSVLRSAMTSTSRFIDLTGVHDCRRVPGAVTVTVHTKR